MVAMGTSAVSKSLIAMYLLATPPTANSEVLDLERSNVSRNSRSPLLGIERGPFAQVNTVQTPIDVGSFDQVTRTTSEVEKVIGEIRSSALLAANWDGEGASAPSAESSRQAVAFLRLLTSDHRVPDATLHASGRTGLFWNSPGLCADLEFLGNWRIAFYIERDGEKLKGTAKFKPHEMPAVLAPVLWV